MRTFKVWHLAALCVSAYAGLLPAAAQQAAGNAPPPPQLEKLEEGEEPTVIIRKPEQDLKQGISEKRARGGKVTEVKVTSGNSTYYLKPNDSPGSALPGDAQSSRMRGAQWEILQFDMNRPKEAAEAEAAQPALPPPAAPAK